MSEPEAVHGRDDKDDPWVMQIVVRMSDEFAAQDVSAAAAKATLEVLASTDPDWQEAVAQWTQRRIRKHVRRAKPAAWAKLEAIPGFTVTVGSATVRAFPPTAAGMIPKEISRCQMSLTAAGEQAAQNLGDGKARGQWLEIATLPDLSIGKAAAAAAHAAQLTWLELGQAQREAWQVGGFALTVLPAQDEAWNDTVEEADVRVVDAGFTEIPQGTMTAVAVRGSRLAGGRGL